MEVLVAEEDLVVRVVLVNRVVLEVQVGLVVH